LRREQRLARFRCDARRSAGYDGRTVSAVLPSADWEVAGGPSGPIPARAASPGVGHNRRGGQTCGQGYGVGFSLKADQRELPAGRESKSPRMHNTPAGKLLRNLEGVAYWGAAAPALARLPAALGYRIACLRGDWLFRRQVAKRTELARNLQLVLGNELSPAAVQQVARDWFRLASCEAVDVKRLRHGALPLRRLVEIRGQEHLEAALAAGKGAILCSAHFGSYDSGFSVLHASGSPVTTIGRRAHIYEPGLSSAERRFWELVYTKPMRRHRKRPNIEPWPGRFQVAALAAAALRANEVVTICIDAPPLDGDQARAVEVPFLGRRAKLLPGVVTLAQVSGAPVLIGFLYRSADYRHQVWEISAPVPMDGEAATAFERCAAEVSAAIRRNPAHWVFWNSTGTLADLGLIQPERDSSAAAPALPPGGRLLHDGPTDSVPAQD
jgi:phosphatidylinositol dimannoside acyltransferase